MKHHGIMAGDLWCARTEVDKMFIVVDVYNGSVYYRPIHDIENLLSLTIKNFLQYRVKIK